MEINKINALIIVVTLPVILLSNVLIYSVNQKILRIEAVATDTSISNSSKEEGIDVFERKGSEPIADRVLLTERKRSTFTDRGNPFPEDSNKIITGTFGPFGTINGNMLEQLQEVEESTILAFIKRFAHVAENEQIKFKIPASITLANALLLSQAGQHPIAQSNNNNFSLQCTKDWIGRTVEWQGQCFRDYENAWTSFRDHSLFLTTGPNGVLQEIGEENYKGWAKALEEINFAGQRNLADQIIRTIEKYKLYRFDIGFGDS